MFQQRMSAAIHYRLYFGLNKPSSTDFIYRLLSLYEPFAFAAYESFFFWTASEYLGLVISDFLAVFDIALMLPCQDILKTNLDGLLWLSREFGYIWYRHTDRLLHPGSRSMVFQFFLLSRSKDSASSQQALPSCFDGCSFFCQRTQDLRH